MKKISLSSLDCEVKLLLLTPEQVIQEGYRKEGDLPHLCLDLPDNDLILTTRLNNGEIATITFERTGKVIVSYLSEEQK